MICAHLYNTQFVSTLDWWRLIRSYLLI